MREEALEGGGTTPASENRRFSVPWLRRTCLETGKACELLQFALFPRGSLISVWTMKRGVAYILMAGWLTGLLVGCSADVGEQDTRDRSLPLMRRAESRRAEGDVDGAVELYKEALLENPRAARAHLDLALLLHDNARDWVGAVYHYRRYLELRPETDKTDMVRTRITRALQLLKSDAAGADAEAEARIEALKARNEVLESEVRRLRFRLEQAETTAAPTPPETPPETPPTPPAAPRTYRVRPGDTLNSIAQEVYGDPSLWRRIYEANQDRIADSDRVPAGLVLTIP